MDQSVVLIFKDSQTNDKVSLPLSIFSSFCPHFPPVHHLSPSVTSFLIFYAEPRTSFSRSQLLHHQSSNRFLPPSGQSLKTVGWVDKLGKSTLNDHWRTINLESETRPSPQVKVETVHLEAAGEQKKNNHQPGLQTTAAFTDWCSWSQLHRPCGWVGIITHSAAECVWKVYTFFKGALRAFLKRALVPFKNP